MSEKNDRPKFQRSFVDGTVGRSIVRDEVLRSIDGRRN